MKLKKGVESGSRSRSRSISISQRCGSGSAPICHGSPTLVNMHNKIKIGKMKRVILGRIGRRR
jgi:hypothetical protein